MGVDDRADHAVQLVIVNAAYRTLGSVVEAEDIMQEAWIRWQNADRTAVR